MIRSFFSIGYNLKILKDLFVELFNIVKDLSTQLWHFCNNLIDSLPDAYKKIKDLYNTNFSLGLYHLYCGNFFDAQFRFTLMKIFSWNNPDIFYNLGRAYMKRNKDAKALKFLIKSQNINDNENIQFYLNMINSVKSISLIPKNILLERFQYQHVYINDQFIKKSDYIGAPKLATECMKHFLPESDLYILDANSSSMMFAQSISKLLLHNRLVFTGISISPDVIENSKKLKKQDNTTLFKELYSINLETFIQNNVTKYNLIILGTLFNYYTDIQKHLNICSKLLQNDTILAFIILQLDQDSTDNFVMNKDTENFEYSSSYIDYIVKSENYIVINKLNIDLYENHSNSNAYLYIIKKTCE